MELPAGPGDPLGAALHSLRMSGVFYSRGEFAAPWGVEMPPIPNSLMFHVVTEGACWLEVGDASPIRLSTGGLALVPHGEGHRLTSEPGSRCVGIFDLPRVFESDRYELLRIPGSGAATTIVCGAVRFDHPLGQHLIEVLPRIVCADTADDLRGAWLRATLQLMAIEARELRTGGVTVMTRLADILVIQAIRAWIEGARPDGPGWINALRDQQLGRAITLIHNDPAHPWTVESLAYESAMSRSAFAARFTQMAGESPMTYLTRWRMRLAATRLTESGNTVGEVAYSVGYRSEAAFSRAFKRLTGQSPGTVRRQSRLPGAAGLTPG